FISDITYGEFLDAIAKSLPCPSAEYVVASKVTWRPQKPLKAPLLPLSGTIGFSIMVEQTVMKKADACIIILMMLAPTKPMEEKVFWSTDEIPAAVVNQDFNYEELNTLPSTEEHVQQRKMTFDQALTPKRMQLEEHYPENNNSLYPNKRVYTDIKTGHAWELMMGRLNVWAAHLVRSATLKKPPAAAAFDMNQRIKATPPNALPPNVLQVAAAPVAPGATATPSITDLFMLHMLQQSQFLANGQPPASTATGPLLPIQRTTSISATTALSAPSSPSKHCRVSLDKFFEFYEIDQVDRKRLSKLDYRPGDAIGKLPEAEWRKGAGFSTLAWDRMLNINRCFLKDVHSGLWL
ncbi:hypothetical protein L208DRAFT_1292573, partial [Tricholoma matsutake]